jgi:hypothetical protein
MTHDKICDPDISRFDKMEDLTSHNRRLLLENKNHRREKKLFCIAIGVLFCMNICMAYVFTNRPSQEKYDQCISEKFQLTQENFVQKTKILYGEDIMRKMFVLPLKLQSTGGGM